MNLPAPLVAIDGARAALLRGFGAPGRALLRDPSLRVVVYGVFGLLMALALTCAAPTYTFALAPLVLGVPHLLVDIRYLVVRPRLHERRYLALAAGAPLAVAAFTQNVAIGLFASVVVALFAEGSRGRRSLVASVALAVTIVAAVMPRTAGLVLAHAHNAIGAIFVVAVFSRRRWLEAIPVLGFVLLSLAIMLGAFDGAIFRPFAVREVAGADSLMRTIAQLAPVSDPVLALRLVALFVFAQGVHYVAWLRLVPELARERRGVRSFSSSLRALVQDVGPWFIVLALLAAAIVLGVAATRSLAASRDLYLALASFHAPLELAALALVAVEGRAALAPLTPLTPRTG